MKKLIPAIVMLLVSAVVLSTASYAWFTTSQAVEASGMSVTATAPTSILISGKSQGAAGSWTAYSNTLNFADIYAGVKLTPASSADGFTFYKPANSYDANGAMDYLTDIDDIDAASTYYVDYQIDLKNDSTTEAVNIAISSIVNEQATASMANAVRVAVIVGTPRNADVAAGEAPDASETNTTVYAPTGYTEDWVNVASKDAQGNYVYTTPAEGPIVTKITGADKDAADWTEAAIGDGTWTPDATGVAIISNLGAQQSVQVTVRVWFEGQDASCISAYAGANANLSIVFGIVD